MKLMHRRHASEGSSFLSNSFHSIKEAVRRRNTTQAITTSELGAYQDDGTPEVISEMYLAGYLPVKQNKRFGVVGTRFGLRGSNKTLLVHPDLIETPNWNIKVTDLSLDKWMLGMHLVGLKINLENKPYLTQVYILKNINTPSLLDLALWDLFPSDEVTAILASRFLFLTSIKLLYSLPPVSDIRAVPSTSTLESVSLAYTGVPTFRTCMSFPTQTTLPNLKKLDLGDIKLDSVWRHSSVPLGTQVKELRLTSSHPENFLPFHFPNITTLSYTLEDAKMNAYDCIKNLSHLEKLTIWADPTNPISQYPNIASKNLNQLTLCFVKELDEMFWVWVALSFPRLQHLIVDSKSIRLVQLPNFDNGMPALLSFTTQGLLPANFWESFVLFAPNIVTEVLDPA